MKVIKTAYERFDALTICLGREGENGVREIHIDISTPLKEYPNASFAIHAKSPDGTEYPVVSVTENETLIWPVCASDTAKNGKGRAQVVMYGASGEIGRSDPVDTLVMTSIIANGNPPDPVQNWLDNVQNATGGAFAPVIETTAAGDAITDAVGGHAVSVVVALSPKLEDGSLAPNPSGGRFAPWTEVALSVNGEQRTVSVAGLPYAGTVDIVTGKTESAGVRVYQATDLFELHATTAPGESSQGVKYIRVQLKAGVQLLDFTNLLVACNRYEEAVYPYPDKSIRVGSNAPYIYDNDIDLGNPSAILEGLEFVLSDGNAETFSGTGQAVVLDQGNNTISSDSGNVTVTYGIDTKTYIDNKFAELSAAVLGG